MSDIKPITPKEAGAVQAQSKIIPTAFIQAVNSCIIDSLKGNEAVVLQKDIIAKYNEADSDHPFVFEQNKHWLDFEPLFERAGWKVEYDKPAYNETYEASFTFKAKKS